MSDHQQTVQLVPAPTHPVPIATQPMSMVSSMLASFPQQQVSFVSLQGQSPIQQTAADGMYVPLHATSLPLNAMYHPVPVMDYRGGGGVGGGLANYVSAAATSGPENFVPMQQQQQNYATYVTHSPSSNPQLFRQELHVPPQGVPIVFFTDRGMIDPSSVPGGPSGSGFPTFFAYPPPS